MHMHYSGKSLFSYAFVANSARQREGHDVAGTSIFRGKISWALCVEWFHSPGVCSLVFLTDFHTSSCQNLGWWKVERRISTFPKYFFNLFWPWHTTCKILVPLPGSESVPIALEVDWTAREGPDPFLLCLCVRHFDALHKLRALE